MKAIEQDEYGTDVMEFRDVDRPLVGDDEVLVKVHAAGLNIADWYIMTGTPYVLRMAGYGLRRPKAKIRGTDVAGRVEAVGRNVTGFAPGDDVFGWCEGSLAEYATAKEGALLRKPDGLTFEQAAAVPLAGYTALQALRDHGQVGAGQKILVNGASGGIGTFAVQIAKAFGAEVTGVCGPGNVELVRSLGADHVIDYSRSDFTRGDERYDLVLDNVGNHSLSALRKVLTPRGTLVPNSGGRGRWLGGAKRVLQAMLLSLFVRHRVKPFIAQARLENLVALAGLVDAGQLTPVVGRTYPRGDAAEALAHVAEGHARGKVVVTV
ncbi:NAD(P)-dependent alcohol dehydrogenase [Saccharothrix sp. NRRL B-16314]|uniref:NAD(P)-dependent alcohol dehydrogenase n=1 Tax=Saccharothrix sp. NRRL B-16314 TaxID=1463825 RepID=UPI0005263E74|nr:NAD(P)-dependent alcohol dehydrogenase [Saccharothrix sp. NRRL B-16314]